jgi:hypothetical protein
MAISMPNQIQIPSRKTALRLVVSSIAAACPRAVVDIGQILGIC